MIPFIYMNGNVVYRVENGVQTRIYTAMMSGDKLHATLSPDGSIYILSQKTIYKMTTTRRSAVPEEIYTHPHWIRKLKVRRINSKNILYFSSHPGGTEPTTIYYLNQDNVAIRYYRVEPTDLRLPDPCNPGGEFTFGGGMLGGNFDFDEYGNLYLSTGNTIPCGFYRVNGAGETGVSGKPVRIHVSNERSCWDLECGRMNQLYFATRNDSAIYEVVSLRVPTQATAVVYSGANNPEFTDVRGFSLVPTWLTSLRSSEIERELVHSQSKEIPLLAK